MSENLPAPVAGSPFQVVSMLSMVSIWPVALMVIGPLVILLAKVRLERSSSFGVGVAGTARMYQPSALAAGMVAESAASLPVIWTEVLVKVDLPICHSELPWSVMPVKSNWAVLTLSPGSLSLASLVSVRLMMVTLPPSTFRLS